MWTIPPARRAVRARRSGWFLVVAGLGLAVAMVAPVAAENPSDVLPDLGDGVYVAPDLATDLTVADFTPVVERGAEAGLAVAIVVAADPQPNSGAFARRVLEAAENDITIVFGPEGEVGWYVDEELEDGAIRGQNALAAGGTEPEVAAAFVEAVIVEPERSTPPIFGTIVRWVVILTVVLVVAAVGEQMIRQFRNHRQRRRWRERSDEESDLVPQP